MPSYMESRLLAYGVQIISLWCPDCKALAFHMQTHACLAWCPDYKPMVSRLQAFGIPYANPCHLTWCPDCKPLAFHMQTHVILHSVQSARLWCPDQIASLCTSRCKPMISYMVSIQIVSLWCPDSITSLWHSICKPMLSYMVSRLQAYGVQIKLQAYVIP